LPRLFRRAAAGALDPDLHGVGGGLHRQFFPLFLLGALFGKLMEDSGSVRAIAMDDRQAGWRHAVLAVVLAGALVTFGGVSLFVRVRASCRWRRRCSRRRHPASADAAAIALGTSTFTMSALPGTPSIQNAIPMPFFGTTPFAAPGLGLIASAIMLGFGLWWLGRQAAAASKAGEGYGAAVDSDPKNAAADPLVRERASTARDFDPAEIAHGGAALALPPIWQAALPLVVVIATNVLMSLFILPRVDADFLAQPQWGETSLAGVGGVWSVIVALLAGIAMLLALSYRRLPSLRQTMDAGANASVLPVLAVASLVGFGAVVAALPAFAAVADWVLTIGGGPLVSLAVAVNILAALTGSASGGLTIALDALGANFMELAAALGIAPELLHRVAVISAGTLDSLPHNGAVVTLLAVCGMKHGDSYVDLAIVSIGGAMLALMAVIALGTVFGGF
jgi:H+/gluconate symporter-like permease